MMFSFFGVGVAPWWGDRGEDSAVLLLTHTGKEQKSGKSSGDSSMGNKAHRSDAELVL